MFTCLGLSGCPSAVNILYPPALLAMLMSWPLKGLPLSVELKSLFIIAPSVGVQQQIISQMTSSYSMRGHKGGDIEEAVSAEAYQIHLQMGY